MALRPQRGIALMAAIFLVVGLGALAAVVLRQVSVQARHDSLDTLAVGAELAAQAGVEWGAYRVLRQGAACPFVQTLPPLPLNLQSFQVQVRCEPDGGGWRLTATARRGAAAAQPDYAEYIASLRVMP